jgi:hypothetical protein
MTALLRIDRPVRTIYRSSSVNCRVACSGFYRTIVAQVLCSTGIWSAWLCNSRESEVAIYCTPLSFAEILLHDCSASFKRFAVFAPGNALAAYYFNASCSTGFIFHVASIMPECRRRLPIAFNCL